ncbi:u3 small nucleolar ribonucleoprotein mpp10 [Stemphylium lycopersici]|nr:u3 small nucleolar ribonucleoprotein mpp10 [Stemphylium lycopersici]
MPESNSKAAYDSVSESEGEQTTETSDEKRMARTTFSTKKVRMPSRELQRMQTAPFCSKHSPLNDERTNHRMAQPSFSPDTSISSHTLSLGSAPPPPMELPPAAATAPTPTSLLANPLAFLQPTPQLNASFLAAAKRFLDPVAAGVSESQSKRQQDLRKKRKRGGGYDDDVNVLHLKKVHIDGFGVNQVFEQTRKIVEAAAEEIELSLPEQDGVVPVLDSEDDEDVEEAEEYHTESEIGEEGVDWEYDGVDDDEDAEPDEDDLNDDEDVDMEDGEEGIFSDDASDDEPAETYQPDPNGLNDGFFSIDDFNKQTDFLEQQDQRGEGADSDDDEINWEADPMEEGAKAKTNGFSGDASDDESDEGGPTFGNVDLNAPEGDSGDEDDIEEGDLDGLDDGMNANNVMYKDFFAPPAQKASKNKNSKKKGRPNPHNFPEKQAEEEKEVEEDVEGTMARVHRDLFEDDDDVESEGDLSDVDPADPKSRRSTHERRQAKIAEEIRRLEAANVAKREWQLSGEARAADRPQNSLLEENLEFERAGKPVPMVTQETSEDIEALIKRRILSGEFDEIHRRRPDDLATGPRRGRVEIDDTKSSKGLAELYEEEHLRATDPNFVEAKDEKLKKEHDEISALWKSVSAKLDSLSSSHFKPKPAAPNLEIRTDAPAIEMEDARPTAGGEVASASMLAPQEVYKPGDGTASKAEIVTKSGMPVSRDEMSREEKMSRRRRAKEAAKKAGLSKPKETTKKTEGKEKNRGEKKQLLGDLKKGGVQVIGRKGVLTDVEGQLPPVVVGATTTTPLVLSTVPVGSAQDDPKPAGQTSSLGMAPPAVVVAMPLVGRTGASGARVLVPSSESPRHEAPVAQVRPFMQQPPPRETGQENQPVEHVYAELEDGVGSGVVVLGGDEDVVGLAAAVVEVEEEDEGWIYGVDLQPTPWHLKPGRQHPPFDDPGQLVYPLASSQLTPPAQVCPSGQHPTSPASELPEMVIQLLPVPQHTSGAPIPSQLLVPSGHWNWRFNKTSLTCMRASQSDCARGRKGDRARAVILLKSLSLSFSLSSANIQLSSINISPSSKLIFLIPIGFSCCNRCFTLNPRFACTSSSGKYLRCFGTLYGHCDSGSAAETGEVAQRAIMAGGNESR